MLKRSSAIVAGLVALAALLGSCASEQGESRAAAAFELPPGAETAAGAIQTETLSTIVDHLADDTLRGRGPSTEGDRLARRYMAGFLQEVGFEPGGPEGRWEQPFELVGISSEMPKIWSFDRLPLPCTPAVITNGLKRALPSASALTRAAPT